MLTRRRFLVLFPAFAVPAIAAPAQSFTSLPFKKKRPIAPPAPVFVYFGTDTKKGVSKGIYQSRFDPKTGQLTTPILAAATARPSFLALSPPRNGPRFVYAVNAVNDRYRSLRPTEDIDTQISISTGGPSLDEIAIQNEEVRRIWTLVETLPGPQRTAMVLKFQEDMKIDDIAAAMGKSPGAVKLLIHRGVTRLRENVGAPGSRVR